MKNKYFLNLYSCITLVIMASVISFPTSACAQASSRSLEENLAIIDGNYNPTAYELAKYSKKLDSLENYCTVSRTKISDMTVNAQQTLKKKDGIDLKTLDLLTAFNNSIPDGAKPGQYGKCSSILATLMVLIEKKHK